MTSVGLKDFIILINDSKDIDHIEKILEKIMHLSFLDTFFKFIKFDMLQLIRNFAKYFYGLLAHTFSLDGPLWLFAKKKTPFFPYSDSSH